jgi:hypothetical protein
MKVDLGQEKVEYHYEAEEQAIPIDFEKRND